MQKTEVSIVIATAEEYRSETVAEKLISFFEAENNDMKEDSLLALKRSVISGGRLWAVVFFSTSSPTLVNCLY